jgi:hypothetical protein
MAIFLVVHDAHHRWPDAIGIQGSRGSVVGLQLCQHQHLISIMCMVGLNVVGTNIPLELTSLLFLLEIITLLILI